MPEQGSNEGKLELPEGKAAAALTVQDSPAPPALVVPGGWRIEGLPWTVRETGPSAERRLLEFFTAEISNPNTRLAYSTAAGRFFRWCETRNLALRAITPFAVATYIEEMQDRYTLPTVKQHLSALRALLDYLVVGQVLPTNPAAPVRGPKHVVKQGKTPVLSAGEARTLLDSIDLSRPAGLRDRALLATMVYSLRPRRRHGRHERRRLLPAGQALVAAPPRKGRQVPPGPRPPQRRGVSRCLPRGSWDRQ